MKNVFSTLMMFTILVTANAQERYSCANPHPQDVINAQNAVAVNGNIYDSNATFAASQAINFQTNALANSALQANDFQLATVNVMGTSSNFLARYNAISNEIEIKVKSDATIYNLNKLNGAVVTFKNDNLSYKAISYIDDDGKVMVDYFLSSKKNPKLLIKEELKFQPAKIARTGYDTSKSAHYKASKDFYYVNTNGALINISAKKKTIKRHFKPYQVEVLAYMKKNKINSNESDLADLVGLISRLEIAENSKGALASNK